MSSNNNIGNLYSDELSVIWQTIFKFDLPGTKILLMGDLNADFYRVSKNNCSVNEKLLTNWFKEKYTKEEIIIENSQEKRVKYINYINLTNLYTQRFNNTFLNGKQQVSRIDYF